MKKIEKGKCVLLTASEGMSLSHDGQVPTERIGQASVVAWEADRWTEIPMAAVAEAAATAQRDAAYKARVEALIAERYSPSDETGLINNMLDEAPTEDHRAEYRAYQAYRAECKARARAELEGV